MRKLITIIAAVIVLIILLIVIIVTTVAPTTPPSEPTPTPSSEPTPTPPSEPSPTPLSGPVSTLPLEPTPTSTPEPTPTPTPTPTLEPTPTPTPTPTPEPVDNPPEILNASFPLIIIMYKDIEISAEATDDRGIIEANIAFSKQGNPIGDVTLEQLGNSLYNTTYSFSTYGTIHYIVTVTDTEGQTDTEEGDIVVHLPGDEPDSGGSSDNGGDDFKPN